MSAMGGKQALTRALRQSRNGLVTKLCHSRRVGSELVHDNHRWSWRWRRIRVRGLGGDSNAGDIIVFTSNDDRLLAIGALQAQDAAVLNASPSDGQDDCEDGKAKDDRKDA